ncbi:hypothetical protein E1B28_001446 [Marasmius oreades]|uniref:Arrestin C-terminal-like domain-containing protein n=1 Tax=Marasmius oreades TaxID=181124 RepID=A0A9P7V3L1_9AGAR|nr:uncharacterized protein E1B28_001446 [Marasmius oreades]KAG7099618.1 hypothetical protein E1B28_001446 [Marasmius oreades]
MYEYSESFHLAEQSTLTRHGTLLSAGASPARNAAELKLALGNANARLKPGASILSSEAKLTSSSESIAFEQAKPRARVEVDLILERYTCVQGGYLNGVVKIRVRAPSKGEGKALVSGGKIRILGLESTQNESQRHLFYLQSATLLDAAPLSMDLFDSEQDSEGFSEAKEGVHAFPFSVFLPLQGEIGNSKGIVVVGYGALVRYLVLVSLKVKERETNRRSITHFYRDCEVWPRFNPSSVLCPATEPNQDRISKSLFMGGSGKVTLTAATHRLIWIAGQQCPVKIKIVNHSKKTIKSVTLTLVRSTVIFKCMDSSSDSSPRTTRDRELTAVEKEVTKTTLETAQRITRGHASAKGWWTGVHPDETLEFSHSLLIPSDALSIARSRLLEVTYLIRVGVSAGALTSDVHVSLPVRIINFLSVDPPPTFPVLDKNFLNLEDDSEHSGLLFVPLTVQQKASQSILEGGITNTGMNTPCDSSRSHKAAIDTYQQDDSTDLSHTQEDNDEFVERAITSMMVDAKYGEHGRFADLYYESLQEEEAEAPEYATQPKTVDDIENFPSGVNQNLSTHSRTSSQSETNHSSSRPRTSNFPQRVRQKLEEYKTGQIAEVGAQRQPVLVSREASVNSSRLSIQSSRSAHELRHPSLTHKRSSTAGSYFRPRHEIPDEVERVERSEEDEDEAEAYSSPLYADPVIPLEFQRSGSRILPTIPDVSPFSTPSRRLETRDGRYTSSPGSIDSAGRAIVVHVKPEFAVAQFHSISPSLGGTPNMNTSTRTRRPRAQTLPAATGPHALFAESRANSDYPSSIATGAAGGSVKDRIRALEEKARVERQCAEASGP